MAEGLRERKRRRTVAEIHHAAMRLFRARGYQAVTITDVAAEADVARATVFAHFPTKEDLVLGDSPAAVDALRHALGDDGPAVVDVLRGWMGQLVGWIDDDLLLQRRLAEEVPAVAAARSRVTKAIQDVIAEALAREPGSDPFVARLTASAFTAALTAIEDEAAGRLADGRPALAPAEVDALFDTAVAFVDGGLARIGTGIARPG